MTEETKTFPINLKSNYVPGTVIEFCHFRDTEIEADERAAINLEDVLMVLNLPSMKLGIIPDYDGDETEAEKLVKFNAAEARSERFGLQILTRKNNTGDWEEIVEIICISRGRKDYIGLLQPFFAKYPLRFIERNDSFGIKLIDYGFGLIKNTDSLRLTFFVRVIISKKNDTQALEARIEALELAIAGRLTQVPANTFLGKNTITGIVEALPQSTFAKPADVNTAIDVAITAIINGAPDALNTLDELAAAFGDDANFASTVTNALATKLDITSNQTAGGNKIFTGFTSFGGSIAIKQKLLTLTTATAQGGYATIAHGLDATKIIRFSSILRWKADGGMPHPGINFFSGYAYDCYYDGTLFYVFNSSTNSTNILGKPITILVDYTS